MMKVSDLLDILYQCHPNDDVALLYYEGCDDLAASVEIVETDFYNIAYISNKKLKGAYAPLDD